MESIVRIASLVPRIVPADPERNVSAMLALIEKAAALMPDLYVFPALCIPGGDLGALQQSRAMQQSLTHALEMLCDATCGINAYIVAGTQCVVDGTAQSCAVVLHKGDVVGCITENGENGGNANRFTCGGLQFSVLPISGSLLPDTIPYSAQLTILSAACTPDAAALAKLPSRLQAQSTGHALCISSLGFCNSAYGRVYKGVAGIFEDGETLGLKIEETEELCCICDIDAGLLPDMAQDGIFPCHRITPNARKSELLRPVSKNPFLPADANEAVATLKNLFDLQVTALFNKLGGSPLRKIVIGVSGGLDSTLALLVCHAALVRLGLPPENLIGVTMPGFGTTGRTYQNACSLIRALGATLREVPIADVVTVHFHDIGHRAEVHDATYENAQARERTQILLDIANQEGALVAGTGDLSEIALGFCTFGGDNISHYNVNASVPKTVIRRLVDYLAAGELFFPAASTLKDILDTPISPELLPSSDGETIGQKTEEILGPYELHDFFLYYFVKYGFAPSKIYRSEERR